MLIGWHFVDTKASIDHRHFRSPLIFTTIFSNHFHGMPTFSNGKNLCVRAFGEGKMLATTFREKKKKTTTLK